MTKNIVIIKQGGWGSISKKDYDDIAVFLKKMLKRISNQRAELSVGLAELKVDIVNSLSDIEDRLGVLNDIEVIIFLSRSEIETAKELRKKYEHIRKVIVLTGLIPDDEILIVEKACLTDDFLSNVII